MTEKKKAHEMTSDELAQRVFAKPLHEHLKRVAHEKDRPPKEKPAKSHDRS